MLLIISRFKYLPEDCQFVFIFSTRQILSGKNGEQMFKLQKDQLERMCGKKEGASVYSQVQVQKTMTGVRNLVSISLLLPRLTKLPIPSE